MTVAVANTNANNFVSFWRTKTNELATAMSNVVVTVNSNAAVGNAVIDGALQVKNLFFTNAYGGNNGARANLTFHDNTHFVARVSLGFGANVMITAGNATHRVLVVNSADNFSLIGTKLLLADLNDFNVSAPANAHILRYDSATSKWVNQSLGDFTIDADTVGGNTAASLLAVTNHTGTIPSARLSGAYTGITGLGTLTTALAVGGVNATFDTSVLYVDATNDRVGVKNAAPTVSLHVTGTDAIFVPVGNTTQRPTGSNGHFRYNNETNQFEGFAAGSWGTIGGGGNTFAHIVVSGQSNVVADTSSNDALTFAVANGVVITTTAANDTIHFSLFQNINTTSNVTFNVVTAADFVTTSDARIKSDVQDIADPMEAVRKLRGRRFKKVGSDKIRIGLIAQEVLKAVPEAVTEADVAGAGLDNFMAVRYGDLVGLLIEAIKDVDDRLYALEKRKLQAEKVVYIRRDTAPEPKKK